MKEKMIYHYGNEKSLLVRKQPHIPELVLEAEKNGIGKRVSRVCYCKWYTDFDSKRKV